MKKIFDKFFRGKDNKIYIGQPPNLPISGWLISKFSSIISSGEISAGFDKLSFGFLFLWAYLEIRYGDSIFRRTLGSTVMIYLLINVFL